MSATGSHVIATSPASDALRHIETSGLPFLSQVKIIVTTVATAGAIVVVRNISARQSTLEAAAPLNPYQPNQRDEYTRSAERDRVLKIAWAYRPC